MQVIRDTASIKKKIKPLSNMIDFNVKKKPHSIGTKVCRPG